MSKKFLVPVVLPANPVAALEAATKQYVDGLAAQATLDARYVNTAGDTMTGALTIDPAANIYAPNIQGNGPSGRLLITNNWLPYSDGGNYFDAAYHVFRQVTTQVPFLWMDIGSAHFQIPARITNSTTGTANLTLKRKAGQTADLLYILNESDVAMPLGITAESRLKLGLISLGDNGMNGMVLRGLQDGGKADILFTDYTANGGYHIGVDNAVGWLNVHSAGNLYLDGNAIYFRTAAFGALATWDTASARFSVPVVLPANPTAALQAATKQYVDAIPGYNWVQEATPTATLAGQRWWNLTTGIGLVALDRGGGVLVWVQDAP